MGNKPVSLSRAIRGLLLTGMVGALQISPAIAQDDTPGDQPPPTENKTAELGKIEVTGTRIRRADVEAARPITVVSKQQIAATGLNSIGDVLQTLASSGAAPNSQFNNGGNGRTNADLRNLGPNRLLVLLNGHRVISGLAGDVDLNTMPLAIVDHVEILQDGASALYGSDAISGVINIITAKDYNGAEANAYLGEYDAHGDGGGWDGKEQSYDFTIGSSSGRGGVVMNVSYVNESPVLAGNRTISKEPVIGGGVGAGSFATPNGAFLLALGGGKCPGQATLGSSSSCFMTLINAPTKNPTLANFRNFKTSDQFNYAPANYLITPSERVGMYVQGHYDLADNLNFDTQVLFNQRNSAQQLAPDTLDLGAFGQADSNGQLLEISGKNPYNPFKVDLVSNSSDACLAAGTCDLLELLGRRLTEEGNRVFNENVDNFQFIGGFTSYFRLSGQEWDWDAHFSYANNYESDVAGGVVNTVRMQQELGKPGAAPCVDAGTGCVPLNLFGGTGSITPAMLSYFLIEQHDIVAQSMRDYTVNATGELMDLPAGAVGMALGAESLETDGYSHPDALVIEGNTGSSLIPPTEGRERTLAGYLEFDIPLVADHPFMKDVHLDIADRWSRFDWKGGTLGSGNLAEHNDNSSSGNASLRWRADDELLLRASWSQSFRIPSIGDLFLADSQSGAALADPCVVSPSNSTVAPFCGVGPYTQPNPSSPSINTTTGGNTHLTPERAISQTVGFVYSPDWLTGLDLSADYYKINLLNAIGTVPPELILNGCYNDGLKQYCELITRSGGDHTASAPGAITDIQNLNTNIGGIKTEGVDVSVRYKFAPVEAGTFKLGVDWSFTKQYVATLAFGTGTSSLELSGTTTDGSGTAGTGQVTGGIPKQRANVTLNWVRGDWSANWSVEYIGALTEDCASVSAITPPSRCPLKINFPFASTAVAGNHIGATAYHDVQVTYHMDDLDADLSVGIRNLFDKQPPVAMSAFANSFLPTFYRTPGRFLYASVGVKL